MSDKYKRWVYLLLLSFIWGSSFILIKKGLMGFGFFEAATIRMMSAGAAFLPFGIMHFKKIPREKYKYAFLSAMLAMFIPAYLFCLAQVHIQSSVSGILNALTPVFTFVFAVLVFKQGYKMNQVIGLILGLACAIMLAVERSDTAISINWYAGLIILATICYGYNINLVKQHLSDIPALVLSGATVSFVGLLAFFTCFLPNLSHFAINSNNIKPLACLVFLGVMSTAVAQLFQYKLIRISSPLFASSATFIMPVIAIFWGLLDGEPFHWIYAFSIAGILWAVMLIRKG